MDANREHGSEQRVLGPQRPFAIRGVSPAGVWSALLAVAALAIPSTQARGQDQGESEAERNVQTGNEYALLVGCTRYDNRNATDWLKGCANDAELLAERFGTVLGLPEDHVSVLSGWPDAADRRPTRANIVGELERLGSLARTGDRVLLFLAGHGTSQPDGADQDEVDGFDEVFLPADAGEPQRRGRRTTIANALTDDDLFTFIDAFLERGVRVVLFSDACHSATLARGALPRARGIEPARFGFDTEAVRARGGSPRREHGDPAGAGFVGLYAVQADEQAIEDNVEVASGESRVHGLFTWSLARALTQTGGEATFDDLVRLIVAGYRELGYNEITPFVQGERSSSVAFRAQPRSSRFYLERIDGRLELDAGTLHGVLAGTELRVRTADETEEVGTVRITRALPLRSACEWVGAPDDVATSASGPLPADVLTMPSSGRALPIRFRPAEGEDERAAADRAALRELDPRGSRIRVLDAEDDPEADWTLTWIDGGWDLASVRDPAGAFYRVQPGRLAETLFGLHRVTTLLAIPARAAGAGLPEGLRVEVLHGEEALADGALVRPGDTLTVRAINRSDQPLDLWAFWLDADLGVAQIVPMEGTALATPFLTPVGKARRQAFDVEPVELVMDVVDETLGLEHLLFLAVPPNTPDLGFLQTGRLVRGSRGAPDDPTAAALDELAFGPTGEQPYAKPLTDGLAASLVAFRVSWGEVDAPAQFEGRSLPAPEGEGGRAVLPDGVPDPWALGSQPVLLERPGIRVAAERGEAPRRLVFDLDAPRSLADAGGLEGDEDLARSIAARTWRAELALVFDPDAGSRYAFYDTDLYGDASRGRPRFDLIRCDLDGDDRADREWTWDADSGWRAFEEVSSPWLSLSALRFSEMNHDEPFDAYLASIQLLTQLVSPDATESK